MSRNIPSLQDLISEKGQSEANSVPKFLTKKERQKLALQRKESKIISQLVPKPDDNSQGIVTKRQISRDEEYENNYSKILERSRGGKKFKFDWKTEEDTLVNDDLYSFDQTPKMKDEMLEASGHWSQKSLSKMSLRDWRILKEDYEIITKNTSVQPLRNWSESALPKSLLDALNKLKFEEPTPIQRASVPIALSKKDIIGIAETGSGKTLAYLLPLLAKILKLPRLDEFSKVDGPYALVLVPTRELAQQIESELLKIVNFLSNQNKFEVISLVGGKLISKDILDLQNKPIEVIIATPGRLIDCLENHYVTLNQVNFFVLDESDKMIEMNFGDQVSKITNYINSSKRQNMMFTATMTSEVESLSKQYVSDPAIINIGNVVSNEMIINERIEQRFELMTSNEDLKKVNRLIRILNSNRYNPPIIVFVNYKESGEFLYQQLTKTGFKSGLIHGSKSQDQREQAIKDLRSGKIDILIGTNVASRGIDINNVSVVINYQMSKKIDDYVHRIGRTGRAGSSGTSISFINEEDDKEIFPELKKVILKNNGKLPDFLKNIDVVKNII